MGITVGVIGCGNITKFHFDGLDRAGARVAWICDLNEEAARPWVERFGARFTADYREILRDDAVDAAWIMAISGVHKEMCLAAMEAGKAVVCEKTLATNPADAADIVRAAEAKQAILYTAYMKRFMPAVEKAKELLPQIGQPIGAWIRSYQPWGRMWVEPPSEGFGHTPKDGPSEIVKRYGGGILVCGGSHTLDLTHHFCGRPTRVFASMFTPPASDFDLQAAALFETPFGPVHYEACAHPLGRIGFQRDGWDERLELNGVDGRIDVLVSKWDNVDDKTGVCIHYDNRSGTSTEYRFPVESAFNREVAHFCAQIERGEQGPQARDTGYVVDELIARVTESAKTGRAVDITYRLP
ncbi:MAG: Gfo/Idh/MocA family protein [Planctomycetota bacterium]